jgi:hypothetical protein
MANRKPLTLTNGIPQGIDNSDTLEVPAGLIVDTTTLVVDSVNNRVGIGTASPAVALDVVGRARASTGILFGTDTADANALDDYEEGTWTPSISGSSGSVTYSKQLGAYTKTGDTCVAFGDLLFDKNTVSGDISITGLPFNQLLNYYIPGVIMMENLATDQRLLVQLNSSESFAYIIKNVGGSVASVLQASDIATGNTTLRFSVTYKVA